jgi:tRNA A37 threonylcarbamoyladenosine dehydratase
MKENQHTRTEMLVGVDALRRIQATRVAIFGIGGVGGYAAEALARAGVGELHLIDHDTVSVTNINRQIIALHSTVGREKVEVMRERIADINPEARVEIYPVFFDKDNEGDFDFSSYDYVVDAIDSLSAKIELISAAKRAGTPIISAMGAGNKLDPTAFRVSDISKTKVCPLARAVRTRLKKLGINHLKVVYSEELPYVRETVAGSSSDLPLAAEIAQNCDTSPEIATKGDGKRAPASISFVPSAMGLVIASEVIRDIIRGE